MNRFSKPRKLRWWQVRTCDLALFLYAVIFQRVLMLLIWVYAVTVTDFENVELSYVLDTPIAGNHPTKMLSIILALIWVYFAICFLSALKERCYSRLKLSIVFITILGALLLATYNFNALFDFAF